ncbi:MAG: response regulator [Lachnospirales bacterium]
MVRVLLVDDEELTRLGMKNNIPWNTLGVSEVYTAEDGEQGLNMAMELKPDIILTDVRMARMDGITMAFEISKKWKKCRFIFISGYCDKAYLKSAIHLSAVDYIEKPIEILEVINAVKKSIIQLEKEHRRAAIEKEYKEHFKVGIEMLDEDNWQATMKIADRIEIYIKENFFNADLSLTVLAEEFNLAKQYMCWLFKKEKKETINRYITKTRLKWANEYMSRNPYVKVKKVAIKSGFSDCSYFIKIYKRHEGITPADYLRKCNNEKIKTKL